MVQFAQKIGGNCEKENKKCGKSTRDCFAQASGAFQEFAFLLVTSRKSRNK
jgi:hypothetical protein